MSLLQDWRDMAYSQETDKAQLQKFWTKYFVIEKGIYEKLLVNPDEVVRGTVKELAESMGTTEKTVRNRIKEHGGFWIDEGNVGKK